MGLPSHHGPRFVSLLVDRLNPTSKRFGHLSNFARIKQISTVKAYVEEFEVLSNCVHPFSKEFKFETFLVGLEDEIHNEVAPFNPQSVINSKIMALFHETKLVDQRKQQWCSPHSDETNCPLHRSAPLGVL